MLNILSLIKRQIKDEKYWFDILVRSKKKETHFLTMLIKLFSYAHSELLKIRNEYKTLKILIDEDILSQIVKKELSNIFLPIIIKTCVYELHVASKNLQLHGNTPEKQFNYFINGLKKTELTLTILKKYPVLKKYLAISLEQYISNNSEIFRRLHLDYPEISHLIFKKKSNIKLKKIEMRGDKHQSGRSVCLLTFKSECNTQLKLVYKPRSLIVDVAWKKFIIWTSQKLPNMDFYPYIVMDRGAYGWCEFVEHLPCDSLDEIKLFYYRIGVILGVSYLLGSNDLHAENIIANGSRPVLIDLECSLKPYIKFNKNLINNVDRHLVTHTYLLPTNIVLNDDLIGVDKSGINGKGNIESYDKKLTWKDVGTDKMRIHKETYLLKSTKNIPFLSNSIINPLDYEIDVKNGFKDCYQIILENKKYLLSKSSVLTHFKRAKIRILFRSTSTYFKLLTESYHPIILHKNKNLFDHLKWLDKHTEKHLFSQYQLKFEKNDLQTGNIPYFYCIAHDNVVYNSEHNPTPIKNSRSPFHQVTNHIKNCMNERDLALQLILIENSYIAARANINHTRCKFAPLKINVPINSHDKSVECALIIIEEILDKLATHHFILNDKICWPLVKSVNEKKWIIGYTEFDLYHGIAGIGLVFAYANKIFYKSEYAEIAKQCLTTLLCIQHKDFKQYIKRIGGFNGLGSIIYTLSAYYSISRDSKLKSYINNYLKLADEYIEADKELDVLSGTAGFILALFSIKEIIRSEKLFYLLTKAANHIYKNYPNPKYFVNAYQQDATLPLIGFSHGISGIILALVKANSILLDPKLDDWVKSALQYERKHFNIDKKNWPDFRKRENLDRKEHDFKMAWCHGAPGIGLSRLELRNYLNDTKIDKEIFYALQTTIKSGFNTQASLCHGNLGNLEFLLAASPYFKEAKHMFGSIFAAIIHQFRTEQITLDFNGRLSSPGMMSGLSGVAYQLMRCIYPNKIPSILMLNVVYNSSSDE